MTQKHFAHGVTVTTWMWRVAVSMAGRGREHLGIIAVSSKSSKTASWAHLPSINGTYTGVYYTIFFFAITYFKTLKKKKHWIGFSNEPISWVHWLAFQEHQLWPRGGHLCMRAECRLQLGPPSRAQLWGRACVAYSGSRSGNRDKGDWGMIIMGREKPMRVAKQASCEPESKVKMLV